MKYTDKDTKTFMEWNGFTGHNTGGGSMAWYKEHGDRHALIACELDLYGDPFAAEWSVGVYTDDDDLVSESPVGLSLPNAVRWAEAGLRH